MNILIPDSWLRKYLITKADPQEIGRCLSLCGASVERVNKINNDWIYNIEITSNRVDMASVIGIAREAAAILPQFGIAAKFNPLSTPKITKPSSLLKIKINDPQKTCQRILAVILDNIKLGPSPKIITQRLEAVGIRSLNNVVDVTNYIMTEIGHPAHIFDYDRIVSKTLILRKAKANEEIVSLENKKYLLPGGDIIIDDGTGKIIDLPGIIGTANSIVTPQTKRVLLFIETADAAQIRKSSMTLGIRTVAATYNEKGVDPELAKTALLRGIQLLQENSHAKIASQLIDIYPNPYKLKNKLKTITITLQLIKQYLGIEIQMTKVIKILQSLGFSIQSTIPAQGWSASGRNNQQLTVKVPSWRANDITIPQDLIEEIARIYGYHNLPSQLPEGKLPQQPSNQPYCLESQIKNYLTDLGYAEIYSYSMQNELQLKNCFLKPEDHLKISNPLTEEWVYMRRSLIPSLLTIIAQNQNYQDKIKIFELANIYFKRKNLLPEEKLNLTLLQTGKNQFFYLKGAMETLFKKIGIKNYQLQSENELLFFNPNKTAKIIFKDKVLGFLGELNQKVIYNFGLKNKIVALELNFEELAKAIDTAKTFTPLWLYPPIIEDLSFIMKPKIYYTDLIQLIKSSSSIVKNIKLIDSYQNTLTLRITYQQQNKNLSSKEVTTIREKIIKEVRVKGWATVKEKGTLN